jgi:hypothetical protein
MPPVEQAGARDFNPATSLMRAWRQPLRRVRWLIVTVDALHIRDAR